MSSHFRYTDVTDPYSVFDTASHIGSVFSISVFSISVFGFLLISAECQCKYSMMVDLSLQVAAQISEIIWSPIEDGDITTIQDDRPPVLSKALKILEDELVDRNTKYMISKIERKVSHARGCQKLVN